MTEHAKGVLRWSAKVRVCKPNDWNIPPLRSGIVELDGRDFQNQKLRVYFTCDATGRPQNEKLHEEFSLISPIERKPVNGAALLLEAFTSSAEGTMKLISLKDSQPSLHDLYYALLTFPKHKKRRGTGVDSKSVRRDPYPRKCCPGTTLSMPVAGFKQKSIAEPAYISPVKPAVSEAPLKKPLVLIDRSPTVIDIDSLTAGGRRAIKERKERSRAHEIHMKQRKDTCINKVEGEVSTQETYLSCFDEIKDSGSEKPSELLGKRHLKLHEKENQQLHSGTGRYAAKDDSIDAAQVTSQRTDQETSVVKTLGHVSGGLGHVDEFRKIEEEQGDGSADMVFSGDDDEKRDKQNKDFSPVKRSRLMRDNGVLPSSSEDVQPKRTPRKKVINARNVEDSDDDVYEDMKRRRVKLSAKHGFQNLGNTCYMNAILQSVLSIEPFLSTLKLSNDQLNNIYGNGWRELAPLLSAIVALMNQRRSANAAERKALLENVKAAINGERFANFDQEDASEFLLIVLTQLNEEFSKIRERSDDAVSNPVIANFAFTLRHCVACESCGYESVHEEEGLDLNLHLPEGSPTRPRRCSRFLVSQSVQSLLRDSLASEKVEHACGCCGSRSAVLRKYFARLPRCMILVMKRYCYDADVLRKRRDKIEVPLRVCLEHCDLSTEPYNSLTQQELATLAPALPSDKKDEEGSEMSIVLETQPESDCIRTDETMSFVGGLDAFHADGNRVVGASVGAVSARNRTISPRAINFNNAKLLSSGSSDEMETQLRNGPVGESRPLLEDRLHNGEREETVANSTMSSETEGLKNSHRSELGDFVSRGQNMEVFEAQRDKSVESGRFSVVSDRDEVLLIDSPTKRMQLLFRPLSFASKVRACAVFGIELGDRTHHESEFQSVYVKITSPPSLTASVRADGNCLFRSLSYCLTDGDESYYPAIRSHVVNFAKAHEEQFRPRSGKSEQEWVEHLAKMSCDGEWGTDLELSVFATILGIEVWSFFNDRWTLYRPLFNFESDGSVKDLPIGKYVLYQREGVYLLNEHFHFSPVMDITREDAGNVYRLVSVVTHRGYSTASGHYVCDVWSKERGCWLLCNDENVSSTDESDVLNRGSTSGYIFFYVAEKLLEGFSR